MLLGALSSNRTWRSGAINASRLGARLTGGLDYRKVVDPSQKCAAVDKILMPFANQRMLFWVLVIGAASASPMVDRDDLVNQATRSARDLGLRNEEQPMEFVVEYLCLLRSQQTVIQEISMKLQSYDETAVA